MKVTVGGGSLAWPDKCAACGAEATALATAKCIVGKGITPLPGFVVMRSNVLAVSYPICGRHRWLAAIFGRISQRNMLNLGFGVLSVLLLLGFIVQVYRWFAGIPQPRDTIPVVYGFLFPAIYGSLFYLGRKFTPVKLADFKEETVTFVFTNEQYAEAFKQMNPEPYPWKRKHSIFPSDAAKL